MKQGIMSLQEGGEGPLTRPISFPAGKGTEKRIAELKRQLKEIIRSAKRMVFDDLDKNALDYLEVGSDVRSGTDTGMPTWWDKVTGNKAWQDEDLQHLGHWIDKKNIDEMVTLKGPLPENIPIDLNDLLENEFQALDMVEGAIGARLDIRELQDAFGLPEELRGSFDPLEELLEKHVVSPFGTDYGDAGTDQVHEALQRHSEELQEALQHIRYDVELEGAGDLYDKMPEEQPSFKKFLAKYGDFPSMKKIMSVLPFSAVAGAFSPLDALEIAVTPEKLGSGQLPEDPEFTDEELIRYYSDLLGPDSGIMSSDLDFEQFFDNQPEPGTPMLDVLGRR